MAELTLRIEGDGSAASSTVYVLDSSGVVVGQLKSVSGVHIGIEAGTRFPRVSLDVAAPGVSFDLEWGLPDGLTASRSKSRARS